MCLSREEARVLNELDQEDLAVNPDSTRLGHGGTVSYDARAYHARLVARRGTPEGDAAFTAHRETHRQEALRLRAERDK